MSKRDLVLPELPPALVTFLRGGQLTVVATVEPDGGPGTTLMSWVVARDATRLALCVDVRSRAYRNLSAHPRIALELLGDQLTWGVRGTARVAKERMDSTPFPCALVEVHVHEVRDHGSPGTVFRGPSYSFTEDKQHRLELEQRVFEELRRG